MKDDMSGDGIENDKITKQKAEPQSGQNIARDHQPSISPKEAKDSQWNTEERERHRKERIYWWITSALTFFAVVGAVSTVVISIQAYREGIETTKQARRQADIAERALSASTRPWISMVLEAAPIVKEQNTLFIQFKVILKNHGPSPALSIWPHVNFYDTASKINIIEKMGAACSNDVYETMIGKYVGGVLYPQQENSDLIIKIPLMVDDEILLNGNIINEKVFFVGNVCVLYRMLPHKEVGRTIVSFDYSINHITTDTFRRKITRADEIPRSDIALSDMQISIIE